MPLDAAEWIERYRRAWEEADADAVVALFTPGALYRSQIFRDPHWHVESGRRDPPAGWGE